MQPQYFCVGHAAIMQRSEDEALKNWTMTMHRAISAYTCCQMDVARLNFGAAAEIASLRLACGNNAVFSGLQLLKPVEFLLELDLAEELSEQAKQRFELTQSLLAQHKVALSDGVQMRWNRLAERVEEAAQTFVDLPEVLPSASLEVKRIPSSVVVPIRAARGGRAHSSRMSRKRVH